MISRLLPMRATLIRCVGMVDRKYDGANIQDDMSVNPSRGMAFKRCDGLQSGGSLACCSRTQLDAANCRSGDVITMKVQSYKARLPGLNPIA